MNKDQMLAKEKVIQAIRLFFEESNTHEVITPVLHEAIPTETNLFPFATTWKTVHGEKHFFLPVSPEATLKKALAAGIEPVYSIGHSFRNLENSGPRHNPEFLMLEWYRKNTSYHDIMYETQRLILSVKHRFDPSDTCTFQGVTVKLSGNWSIVSFEELYPKFVGVTLESVIEGNALEVLCRQKGYNTHGASWQDLFDQVFLNHIEPFFSHQPFFLVDFPARISPLCKPRADKPYLAERFELYIGGMEIGNGNTEETDSHKVRRYFETIAKKRHTPVDEEFLNALDSMRGSSYAGIGLGVDRLVMLLSNANHI